MSRNLSRQEIRSAILDGMAQHLWFWAWSNMAIDTGICKPRDLKRNVPPVPAAAKKPARELARLIESEGRDLGGLFSESSARSAHQFGEDLAAASLIEGAREDRGLRLPNFAITFDPDLGEIAWDGTAWSSAVGVARTNPAIERILLIEDEPARQDDMVRLFKRIYPSAAVEIADNAIDANAQIDAQRYDLIVSDFDLADGTTGGDVLDHLHDKHPKLVNRFLFVSGNSIVQDMHPYWIMKGEVTKAAMVAALARMPVANPSCCSGCA